MSKPRGTTIKNKVSAISMVITSSTKRKPADGLWLEKEVANIGLKQLPKSSNRSENLPPHRTPVQSVERNSIEKQYDDEFEPDVDEQSATIPDTYENDFDDVAEDEPRSVQVGCVRSPVLDETFQSSHDAGCQCDLIPHLYLEEAIVDASTQSEVPFKKCESTQLYLYELSDGEHEASDGLPDQAEQMTALSQVTSGDTFTSHSGFGNCFGGRCVFGPYA